MSFQENMKFAESATTMADFFTNQNDSTLIESSKPTRASSNRRKYLHRDSALDFKADLDLVEEQYKSYKAVYMILGGYSITTSLLNYPFQSYLKQNNYNADDINRWRIILFIPWMIKPLMGLLADVVCPFRYKLRGWIYLCTAINLFFGTLALSNKDNPTLVCVVTAVIVFSNVMLDTVAQGAAIFSVDLDRRRNRVGESLGEEQRKSEGTNSRSHQPEGSTQVLRAPTFIRNFGTYSLISASSRSACLVIAFWVGDSNCYHWLILAEMILTVLVSVSTLFTHELKTTRWYKSKEVVSQSFGDLKRALRIVFVYNFWRSMLVIMVMIMLTLNPANYYNELFLDRMNGNSLMTYQLAAISTAVCGCLVIISFGVLVYLNERLGIGSFVAFSSVLLVVNCVLTIPIQAQTGYQDSIVTLHTWVAISSYVQAMVSNLNRMCLVCLFMRPLENCSFGLIYVNSLTTIINTSQYFSKVIENIQRTETSLVTMGLQSFIGVAITVILFSTAVFFWNHKLQEIRRKTLLLQSRINLSENKAAPLLSSE